MCRLVIWIHSGSYSESISPFFPMTAHNNFDDDENLEIIALLASLDVADARQTHPPRTPSPNQPPPYALDYHISPAARPRTLPSSPPSSLTIYRYTTPTRIGYTPDWSALHTIAFQLDIFTGLSLVPPLKVSPTRRSLQFNEGAAKRKGSECGKLHMSSFVAEAPACILLGAPLRFLFFFSFFPLTFHRSATERLVSGVPNCIFRGYATVSEAKAAYAYACARSWTRSTDTASPVAFPSLPAPVPPTDDANPLNGSEILDNRWYVVYRGITPGVYRSQCVPSRSRAHRNSYIHLQPREPAEHLGYPRRRV